LSKSSYYECKRAVIGKRALGNLVLLEKIREFHMASRGTYGSPRINEDLKEAGIRCGRGRVAKLMRLAGLRGKQRQRFTRTTDSKHSYPVAPNLLAQDFDVKELNRVWVSDITYIPTGEGWLYLATVLDLCSRKIVGWAMGERIDRGLVMTALNMAIAKRRPGKGLLHHSDRGSQYASNDYQELLRSHGMICSMSGKGNCYDNAVAESFYHTLKVELVHGRSYQSRREAVSDIFEYIEVFYNRKRRHSSLGYLSPANFELKLMAERCSELVTSA